MRKALDHNAVGWALRVSCRHTTNDRDAYFRHSTTLALGGIASLNRLTTFLRTRPGRPFAGPGFAADGR